MKLIVVILLLTLTSCIQETDSQRTSITYVSPTNGYSQMVVVEDRSVKALYISGQVGTGDDLETQMREVLSKLSALLEKEGGDFSNLVKINTYIVDYSPDDLDVFREVRKEIFSDDITPASTLVGVQSLALPEWMIEIDAMAIINK